MKFIYKIPALLFIVFFFVEAGAQIRINPNAKIIISKEDSLLREFENTVYHTFYGPGYRKAITNYTILKVNLNWDGKVTDISFSDSADTSFVNAWKNKKSSHDDKATLERYAQIKGYKNISLLFPVNYLFDLSQQAFSSAEREMLMRFNKQNFNGNAIVFEPIKIGVLSKGDR